jgi:exosome complex component RRP42
MGDELKDIVMSQIRKDVMLATLAKGTRYDGRDFGSFRKVEVQKGVLDSAEGSALACIGGTKVLASVKFDIVTPFSDRPKEGVLISNAELLPTASPSFETGPPDENSIEFARIVDRAVRSAECVNLKSFFVEEGKVISLFLDLYVLDHSGNFIDAGTLAASAALANAKMPKIENAKMIRGEYSGPLNARPLPVSVTMVKVGGKWLVDPSREEELVQDCRITIATTDEHVCAIQKGKGSLSRAELMDNIDIAFKRGSELRSIVLG